MEDAFAENNPSAEQDNPTEGFVKEVRAEEVHFGPGLAVSAAAGQDLTLSKGGAVVMAAGRDAEVSKGYVQVMVAGHDVAIDKGGGQVMVVGHDMQLENGAALVSISSSFTGRNTFAGFVFAPKVELGEGSRVLFNTREAIIFGAVTGLVLALFRLIFGKK